MEAEAESHDTGGTMAPWHHFGAATSWRLTLLPGEHDLCQLPTLNLALVSTVQPGE